MSEHPHESICERITVEDYWGDEAKRERADAIMAALGYKASEVVEIRVGIRGGIAVDVLDTRRRLLRTDRWPATQGRERHDDSDS